MATDGRDPLDGAPRVASTSWWGWGLLAAVLAVRAVAYEWSFQWVETATLLPAIACLTWAFGGWPLLYRAWPAILFLVFMLPLPIAVNGLIALPLQRLAATGSYILLQLSGFWVIQQGNVLNLTTPFGMRPLDVALACSGLKMLMTLAATVTATIMLLPLPGGSGSSCCRRRADRPDQQHHPDRGDRVVLLLHRGEDRPALGHDISGWMMMPRPGLGLERQILAWLVPERNEAEEEERQVVLPLIATKRSGQARQPAISRLKAAYPVPELTAHPRCPLAAHPSSRRSAPRPALSGIALLGRRAERPR